METTIRINTDLLNADIIEGIRKMFPHKVVEINVQPADETEFITENPAFAAELKERINEYKSKQEGITLKANELL
jgi:hypothetical protein